MRPWQLVYRLACQVSTSEHNSDSHHGPPPIGPHKSRLPAYLLAKTASILAQAIDKDQQASTSSIKHQQVSRINEHLMHPWFALLITRSPVGQGIWTQRRGRSKTRLACSPCRTPPLGIYTTKARCPSLGGLLRIHSPAPMATGLQTSLSGFHKRTQQRFSPWAAPNRPT